MPDIQNSEQMIPNYKKVIHPLEVLVSIVNSTTPRQQIFYYYKSQRDNDFRGSSFAKRIS